MIGVFIYSIDANRRQPKLRDMNIQGGLAGGLNGRRSPARVMPKLLCSIVAKDGDYMKRVERALNTAVAGSERLLQLSY